jgi:hypothetical protein
MFYWIRTPHNREDQISARFPIDREITEMRNARATQSIDLYDISVGISLAWQIGKHGR